MNSGAPLALTMDSRRTLRAKLEVSGRFGGRPRGSQGHATCEGTENVRDSVGMVWAIVQPAPREGGVLSPVEPPPRSRAAKSGGQEFATIGKTLPTNVGPVWPAEMSSRGGKSHFARELMSPLA
jgi:hypothetical protein